MIQDVEEFHEYMGFYPFIQIDKPRPTVSFTEQVNEKRKRLIMEEARELCDAIDSGDAGHILQEAIDLQYVALGALVEAGINSAQHSAAWNAVHAANMRKSPPADPLGKAEKHESWEKPDMEACLLADEPFSRWLVSYMLAIDGEISFGTAVIPIAGELTNSTLAALCSELGAETIISMARLDTGMEPADMNAPAQNSEPGDREPTIEAIEHVMDVCDVGYLEAKTAIQEMGVKLTIQYFEELKL